MAKIFRTANRWLPSDNLKSKIENLKLVGLLAIALTFTFGGAVVDAQQTGKSSASVSWIIALLPVWQSSWRRFGKS